MTKRTAEELVWELSQKHNVFALVVPSDDSNNTFHICIPLAGNKPEDDALDLWTESEVTEWLKDKKLRSGKGSRRMH